MSQIHFRDGYKYQLAKQYRVRVNVKPRNDIKSEFIDLSASGQLLIRRGYAWDGPSGIAIDRKRNMRASLVHDALYQLMRQSRISKKRWRKEADLEYMRICIQDGMKKGLAEVQFNVLRRRGGPAASPKNKKKVFVAPGKRR